MMCDIFGISVAFSGRSIYDAGCIASLWPELFSQIEMEANHNQLHFLLRVQLLLFVNNATYAMLTPMMLLDSLILLLASMIPYSYIRMRQGGLLSTYGYTENGEALRRL